MGNVTETTGDGKIAVNRRYFKYTDGKFDVVTCDCCRFRYATAQLQIVNPITEQSEVYNLCDNCRYYMCNVIAKAVKNGIKPRYEE